MKNKTLAAWLALLFGWLGAHRFYLHGWRDVWGWLLPIPSLLGLYGVQRVADFGQDDMLSWWLIPAAGFAFASCALSAIIYGLMTREQWNARFNPSAEAAHGAGGTRWLTIGAVVLSLMLGATALTASIVFSFQRYFEYQIEEARKISQ